MTNERFAGIVLYNPDIQRLKMNLDALIEQASTIVMVENGSDNTREIREFTEEYSGMISIIENGQNLGMAKALNQILDFGLKQGFEWVLMMDQDSIADRMLLSLYMNEINDETIILCPSIIDMNLPELNNGIGKSQITNATDVITSGSYINIRMAKEVGGFDERLFIDFVDTDFQERCLRSGYKIFRVNAAKLYHEVGKLEEHSFLGFHITCSNHSALRRYYMVRNRLYYRRKYFGYKAYLLEKMRLILGTAKIVLFEENKRAKICALRKGCRDYKVLLNCHNC